MMPKVGEKGVEISISDGHGNYHKYCKDEDRLAQLKWMREDDLWYFLLGEKDYNGLWFGDKNEKGEGFWWRTLLRKKLIKIDQELN